MVKYKDNFGVRRIGKRQKGFTLMVADVLTISNFQGIAESLLIFAILPVPSSSAHTL
jgi:hypothetical protein